MIEIKKTLQKRPLRARQTATKPLHPAVAQPRVLFSQIITPPTVLKDIKPVNPTKIIATRKLDTTTSVKHATSPTKRTVKAATTSRWKKVSASIAAGATTVLTPVLAYASSGTIGTALSSWGDSVIRLMADTNLGPAGWGIATLGIIMSLRLIAKTYKAAKAENVQSPESKLSTGSPTPKKLLKTLVIPTFLSMTTFGGTMAYLEAINLTGTTTLLGLPIDSINWQAFWVVSAAFLTRGLLSSVKDTYIWAKWKLTGVQHDNLRKSSLIAQLASNFFVNPAWVFNTTFMALLGKVFATQFIFSSLKVLPYAALNILPTAAGLGLAAKVAIPCALAFGIYQFFAGSHKDELANPHGKPYQKAPNRIKSTLAWASTGAALGVGISLISLGASANLLLTFLVCLAFAHNFIHSGRSQEAGDRQAKKKFPIDDLRTLNQVVRGAWGAVRTVFKPGIDMKEPLTSAYIMALISEGAHWVLNGISGAFNAMQYTQAQQMIEKLINTDTARMRRIISKGYIELVKAKTHEEAQLAAANVYEQLSLFLHDGTPEANKAIHGGNPRCLGNLAAISGLGFLENEVFNAGNPGARKMRSDQDLRVHGEHLRFAALLLRKEAEAIREHPKTTETLESLKELLGGKLNAVYCRAFPHFDTHPGRFFTNILPDSYNAKQFVIDLCKQTMADYVGAFDVVVMNEQGQVELWMIPMRIVKDFKPNYREVNTIESQDEKGEDLRLHWYDRLADGGTEHDIGETNCPIAYIDNSAHHAKYQTMGGDAYLAAYPTAEVTSASELKMDPQLDPATGTLELCEFYDVVYKNGARLRVYANGEAKIQPVIEETESGLTIVHEKELPDRAPALLMLPGTKREQVVAKQARDILGGTGPTSSQEDTKLYAIDPQKIGKQVLKRLRKADVPMPKAWATKGANSFSNDKYLRPRWRFMYPTEYTSVSDADQMDLMVTNLRLYHWRANPHLRVMMTTDRKEKLPFPTEPTEIMESDKDSFLEAGIATVWMIMKVALNNGQELCVPLNLNKENERTFGAEIWRYIDEKAPLKIRRDKRKDGSYKYQLGLTYNRDAVKDDVFNARISQIEWVDMPVEMEELVGQGLIDLEEKEVESPAGQESQTFINPIRYGSVGGPIPVVDYLFTRRNSNGEVTDSTRTLTLPERVAQIIVDGNASLMSEEEIKHVAMVKGNDKIYDGAAWVDKNGNVHVRMDKDEYKQVEQWLARVSYQGRTPVTFNDHELTMNIKHFRAFCNHTYWEISYQRFMQSDDFKPFFDPTATVPWGRELSERLT